MFHPRRPLIAVASVALVASAASPAHADRETFKDKRGDLKTGYDIRSVYGKNGGRWITVKVRHRNLKRRSRGFSAAYIDTVRSWRGPEFMLTKGIGRASGNGIVRMRNWVVGTRPVPCRHGMNFRINYRTDVVTLSVKRRCLAKVFGHAVRGIRVGAVAGKPGWRLDHAPRKHHLYPKIARN